MNQNRVLKAHSERGEGFRAPSQGAQLPMDFETQGVALGWHAPALLAPEPEDLYRVKPRREQPVIVFVSAISEHLREGT
jgi:hypothetical protein